MEATHLRIGNLYLQKGGNFVQTVNKETFILIESRYVIPEGILITEQWLLDFGFVYDNNWHYKFGENPLTKDYLMNLCWIDGEEFPFYRNGYFKIKYIHQLQNLYFALTQTELILKP